MAIQITNEIRRMYNGVEYVIQPDGDNVTMNGVQYTSATAVVRAIMGAEWTSRVVARSFLGLPAYDGPRRTRTQRIEHSDGTTDDVVVFKKISGKCKHNGCYEPADCKHGFCSQHCNLHSIGSYSDRRYPRSDLPHIGVEIEVVYKDADSFRRGVGIDCHRDGSLGTYGAEYKVLAKSTVIASEVAELVQELWKRRARVNRSCGLHVHLDVRQIGDARRTELLDWMQRTEQAWFGLMPPSRCGSSYARLMTETNRNDHFTWAHVTSYNTVEIRLHGGTLNPYKIAGWVTALVHLQAKTLDASYTFPCTGDADADFWTVFADCPMEGKEYLATRKACGGVVRDAAFGHIEE
jgi:hypothetical protein